MFRRQGAGLRLVKEFEPGISTASSRNVQYRLGKLHRRHIISGKDWLDCGCADGGYITGLRKLGASVIAGIDIEAERVKIAANNELSQCSVHLCVSPSEHMPFADRSFDGVLVNEVLEHVVDELQTLREIFRLLRPGGYLALMSPSRWFPFEGHGMLIHDQLQLHGPVPLLPWLPLSLTNRFLTARNYWPAELAEMVESTGFIIVTTEPVLAVFDFYPWAPKLLLRWYQRNIDRVERVPIINRLLGVSTLVIGRKPLL